MWDEIDAKLGEMSGAAKGETIKKYSGVILLGRVGVPEDVAETVSYLAGKGSDYMTGQTREFFFALVYVTFMSGNVGILC